MNFTHEQMLIVNESLEKIIDSKNDIIVSDEIEKLFEDIPLANKRSLFSHMGSLFLNVMLNRTYLGSTAVERSTEGRMVIKRLADQLND
jgi:hypothetical protein